MKQEEEGVREFNFDGDTSEDKPGQSLTTSPLSPLKRKLTKKGELVVKKEESDSEEKELRIVELL